jgi:hypothetical protein
VEMVVRWASALEHPSLRPSEHYGDATLARLRHRTATLRRSNAYGPHSRPRVCHVRPSYMGRPHRLTRRTIQLYRRPVRWMANHPHANLAKQRIQPACSQPAASTPPPPPRSRRRRRDPAARARAPLSPARKHPSWGCSTHERSATSSLHIIYSCTTTTSPSRHTLTPYPSREVAGNLLPRYNSVVMVAHTAPGALLVPEPTHTGGWPWGRIYRGRTLQRLKRHFPNSIQIVNFNS